MSETELDLILHKVWQNGYQINRWEELKVEIAALFAGKVEQVRGDDWETEGGSIEMIPKHLTIAYIQGVR